MVYLDQNAKLIKSSQNGQVEVVRLLLSDPHVNAGANDALTEASQYGSTT